MSERKSFTGWVERPAWERTILVLLIVAAFLFLLYWISNGG